ncbi:MAG: DUF1460 domain-containing protein [Elusimicrobia bacterium]|nr:DUF1460 domain-containing protein [Elusimicrobiota bacterium]
MSAFAAALLLLAAQARAAAPPRRPQPFYALTRPQLERALLRIHAEHRGLRARVEAVSERFLGTPYRLGPLGEGPRGLFDRDPLVRFDAVDCTTFVEETMALSLRPKLADALDVLRRIRYENGRVGFSTRNHFPSVDWLPRNLKAGYLRDITRRVAGADTLEVSKTISKRRWYAAMSTASLQGPFSAAQRRRLLPRLRGLGRGLPEERATLPVLPMAQLARDLARIPSGTLANLVRADRPDKPVLVSHQVLLIRKGKTLYVRHAAFGAAVVDVPAPAYFRRYARSSWPLLGLNLDEIRDPEARGH